MINYDRVEFLDLGSRILDLGSRIENKHIANKIKKLYKLIEGQIFDTMRKQYLLLDFRSFPIDSLNSQLPLRSCHSHFVPCEPIPILRSSIYPQIK